MSVTAAQLLADLRGAPMARGEARIAVLLASTSTRRSRSLLVNSGPSRERDTVNIDTRIYGYTYESDLLCPTCTIDRLIEQGKASPAAREMGEDAVIEQIQEADAASTMERLDSDRYPQSLSAYSGLTEDDTCGGCGEVLYQ